MAYIRTRNDLINWLEKNSYRRAIRRSITEGKVENLGAFQHLPASKNPGWIVRVTSRFGRVWYIAVQLIGTGGIYLSRIIDEKDVPWESWIGDDSSNPLYQGDDIKKYKENRGDKIRGNTPE